MRDCFLDVAGVRLPIYVCLNEDSGAMNERFTGNDEKAVCNDRQTHITYSSDPRASNPTRN